MSENKCPKCESEPQNGFILDRAHSLTKLQAVWVEGDGKDGSLWDIGAKTTGKNVYKMQAMRCPNCNTLELYTTEKIYI